MIALEYVSPCCGWPAVLADIKPGMSGKSTSQTAAGISVALAGYAVSNLLCFWLLGVIQHVMPDLQLQQIGARYVLVLQGTFLVRPGLSLAGCMSFLQSFLEATASTWP